MYKTYADAIYAAAAEEGLVEYVDAVLPKTALTGHEMSELWETIKTARSKGLPKGQYEAEYQRLVLDRLPYAFHTAIKYRGRGVPLEDLFQEAILVVMDVLDHRNMPANQIAATTSTCLKNKLEKIISRNLCEGEFIFSFDITLERCNPEEILEALYNTPSGKAVVNEVLTTLTRREEMIIRLRHGLNVPQIPEKEGEELTYRNIAKTLCDYGFSSSPLNNERIRQIYEKGLRKLRHPSRSKPLRAIF